MGKDAELVDLIGAEAYQRLLEHHRGEVFYIPVTYRTRHRLADSIGDEAFKTLIQRYGGTVLVVPLGQSEFERQIQDLKTEMGRRILELHREGATIQDIIRRLRVGEKFIRTALRKAKVPPATDP